MYIQGYGDKTMGLWNLITTNLKNQQSSSSPEYTKAFNAANQSIGQTQDLANQYTGNAGYVNSLNQAATGAGKLANAAIGQGTSGARSAGMSKAQAAQMGVQNANNAYANAFQNQQNVAQGMGQNAISAQQGITSAQQGQAGQAAAEKQNVYGRAAQNAQAVTDRIGSFVANLR